MNAADVIAGPKVTALAPWFGSNRLLAHRVGELLAGCRWVGVPFAGGMCELAHIEARTLLVNDKHEHVINLARVVACPKRGPALIRRLRRVPFHPWALEVAQRACATYEPCPNEWEASLNFAESYFICAWMARNGCAGTANEFNTGMSIRFDAGGGDSCVRFRSATESLREWNKILARCSFTSMDAFNFLHKCKDNTGHGIYCDPPFPEVGDNYKHTMTPGDHREFARRLTAYKVCRIVCRFYDHPLIRELYPEDRWTWHLLEGGRTQANKDAPEVLLVNRTEVDRG